MEELNSGSRNSGKVPIFDGLRNLKKEDISISLSQEEVNLFKMACQEEAEARETQFVLGGGDR
ncbi:MAG: hypothetical protein A2Y66_01025 [Nitrospirae bacterium RBG_13_41_22]|nr:MAG: hypothetical protein A2Y66_01025 [Nitrospirae bacterium RBG_13_41_22]